MKLTIKQLNNLKKFIKNENDLKKIYSSVTNLNWNDYYKCFDFEFLAIDKKNNKFNDLIRFETEELIEIIK